MYLQRFATMAVARAFGFWATTFTGGPVCRHGKVVRFDPEQYQEDELQESLVLAPVGKGWNADDMHHIDLYPQPDGRY